MRISSFKPWILTTLLNHYLTIFNDVRFTPRLSVIVEFKIDIELFETGGSFTPQNLTVSLPDIEEHIWYFNTSESYSAQYTLIEFTKLRAANSYTFTVQFCTEDLCVERTEEHDTSNLNCGPEDDYKTISTSQVCDNTLDCPIGRWDEQKNICKGSPFVRNIRKVYNKKMFHAKINVS